MRGQTDALEGADLLGDRALGRQPLYRTRAIEAVHAAAVRDDVLRVGRFGNRSAVADDQHVGVHAARGVGDGLNARHAVVQRLRRLRPDGAAGRDAHVGDDDVGAGAGHPFRLSRVEDVRCRQQVELVRLRNHVDFELVAHPGLFERLAHVAVEEPYRREVLDAREPHRLQLLQEEPHQDERVGAVDAGEHRRPLDHGEDLVGHLLHDLVRVAIGEQTRGAAAAGHPVAAGVVDDQEVDAPGLLALRREARAGSAADDGLAACDLLAKPLQDALPGIVDGHDALLRPPGWYRRTPSTE